MYAKPLFFCTVLILCVSSLAAGQEQSKSFKLLTADVDAYEVVIHNKKGGREWVYDEVRCMDAWLKKNGEVVIAYLPSKKTQNRGGLRIVDKDKKVILDHQIKDEAMSCCLLPNGNILFAECGKGVLSEITRDGKIARQITLKSKGKGHKTVRFIRVTPQNTILACECYSHIVREYDWSGKVLAEFNLTMAYHATRLKNGNTLVSGYKPPRVVEFDKQGKPVWEADLAKIKSQGIDFGRTQFCEATRLANGNTLITNCNRANREGETVVVEVTPEMKVVSQWKATKTTKGVTAAKPILE